MRKFKKEQYYVNSLNTPLPESLENEQLEKKELKTFSQLKLEIYKERLMYFKGNLVKAAKSLDLQRNAYCQVLGKDLINEIKTKCFNEDKEKFIHTFNSYNGNIRIISNRLKMNKSTAANLAVKYGLKKRSSRIKKEKRLLVNKNNQILMFK